MEILYIRNSVFSPLNKTYKQTQACALYPIANIFSRSSHFHFSATNFTL